MLIRRVLFCPGERQPASFYANRVNPRMHPPQITIEINLFLSSYSLDQFQLTKYVWRNQHGTHRVLSYYVAKRSAV